MSPERQRKNLTVTETPHDYIAFEGSKRIATGTLNQVALKVKHALDTRPQARILVFNQATSELIDFDHRGTPEQMLKKLAPARAGARADPEPPKNTTPPGPGRPRLGVVGREVTLLPRHWEWLNTQPGGASVALRKLVEQARRANQSRDGVRVAQEAAYRFMSAMAGHRTGFEEAARALFAADRDRFQTLLAPWPADIREHLAHLASAAFDVQAIPDGPHA